MYIRLSTEDAERLGCPRDLGEFDREKLMGREVMAIEEQVGWSFSELDKEMAGEPLTDLQTGAPIWETDAKGKLVTDDKGKPVQQRVLKAKQLMVAVWLCVYRHNPVCAWETFDINLYGVEFIDDEPAGKGDAGSSGPSGSGTKSRSAKRSGSRRGSKKNA